MIMSFSLKSLISVARLFLIECIARALSLLLFIVLLENISNRFKVGKHFSLSAVAIGLIISKDNNFEICVNVSTKFNDLRK